MPRDPARSVRALPEQPAIELDLDGLDGMQAPAAHPRPPVSRRDGLSLWFAHMLARIDGLARFSAGVFVAASAAAVGYGGPSAFFTMVRRLLGEPPRRLAERRKRQGCSVPGRSPQDGGDGVPAASIEIGSDAGTYS
jgi:hypothetical protein